MRLRMLLLSGLVFAVSSINVSFAETQDTATNDSSKSASEEVKNADQAEAMARLRIEEEVAGEADADLAQDASKKGQSDGRPRFGVNRQLDMRNSSQMRGR